MTTFAVASGAASPTIVLNPTATNVNVLDTSGYNVYAFTANPVSSDSAGDWSVALSGLTGASPAVQVLDQYGNWIADEGSLTAGAASGTIALPDYVPGDSDEIALVGDTTAVSSVVATAFMDTNKDGSISDGEPVANAVTVNWLDPKAETISLTAPSAIAGGDAIASTATLSPALAPSVLSDIADNGALAFSYFDNTNSQFDSSSWPSLADDGTFSNTSEQTYPRSTGVFKSKAVLLGELLGGSAPKAVKTTTVTDYNVGHVDFSAPAGTNISQPLFLNNISAGLKNKASAFCGVQCDFAALRAGVQTITYTATVTSNDDHPTRLANVPVEFSVSSDLNPYDSAVKPLTANGTTIANGKTVVVTALTDADGVAKLAVTDPNQTATGGPDDAYFVDAFANGEHGQSRVPLIYGNYVNTQGVCAQYQTAAPTFVKPTVPTQTVQTGKSTTVAFQIVDQWMQPIGNSAAPADQLNYYISGRHETDDLAVNVHPDGTTDPITITDDPTKNDVGIDGTDSVRPYSLTTTDGTVWFCSGSALVSWVQDTAPSFVALDGNNIDSIFAKKLGATNVGLSKLAAKSTLFSDGDSAVDTSMGTDAWRQAESLQILQVKVTNSELPAAALAGTPVTFAGPAGTQFFPADEASFFNLVENGVALKPLASSTPTVLTDGEGMAYILASNTKTGDATFTATSGAIAQDITATFYNYSDDARNIAVSPSSATLTSGTPQHVVATVTDVFGNPVEGVDVDYAETGAGRMASGYHTEYGTTGPDGTDSADVTTAPGEAGVATLVATVNDDGESQVNDPAGFIYDEPVPGVSAGNGDATSTLTYTLAPTFAVAAPVITVAGVVPVTGHATPGAVVTLLKDGVAAGTTTAGSDGSFGFAPMVTKTTGFAVSANGLTAPSQTVTLITLPAPGVITVTKAPAPVIEKPKTPLVSSPFKQRLRAGVLSSPRLAGIRVDWYAANAKGVTGKYLGSTITTKKGWGVLVLKTLKSGSNARVRAFVHGVPGKVYGGWSPTSAAIHIK